ncbi:MAG: MYXO-CTERM sorting domain-containing protein [Kofleriaceae bacterium]
MSRARRAAALAAVLLGPGLAAADRDPWQAGTTPLTYGRPGGRVLVHYVTTTVDAALPTDADASGVPDFVEEVALRGDQALARFVELGFRPPRTDGTLGGDDRLDIYLRNLNGADGSFTADTCTQTPFTCAGHVTMENDFVGYSYPTTSIGVQVLTSHELFHAVQNAYDGDQPVAWMEGSAVWAEEVVFPAQDDFEHLVAAFLAKPFRPFERDGAGFGDLYPYGAGLWPYFLEAKLGPGIVAATWAGCEDAGADPAFLDALDVELAARGTTVEDAWIEFTRWNARTGRWADGTGYPDAARLPLALREAAITAPGQATVITEGLSARYQPITGLVETSRVTVTSMRPVALDVRATAGDPTITRVGDDGVATSHTFDVVLDGAATSAELEVIVSGATRGGIQQEVTVAIAPYTPPDPPAEDAGCGCQSSPAGGGGLVVAAAVAALLRRRRYGIKPAV